MIRVYHVSDLHMSEHPEDNAEVRTLLQDIRRTFDRHTDHLLVTGDVVDDPEEAQMKQAVELLSPFRGRLLIVPGNHDYTYAGNFVYTDDHAERFEHHILEPLGVPHKFVAKKPAVDVLDDGAGIRVLAIGLNSNRRTKSFLDWATGEIEQPQRDRLAGLLADPAYAAHWRLVYMHHRAENCGLSDPVMKLRDDRELLAVVKDRVHVLAFGHSGGSKDRRERATRVADLGMRTPKEGAPYFINANHSVAKRQCFVVTFEEPAKPGAYPSVALHRFRDPG